MKFVALISGGKDSIFNILKCIEDGHELVALVNLHPKVLGSETDSYMYQSVGSENIVKLAECLDKPLFRREITGKPVVLDLEYKGQSPDDKKGDEVEDLYEILKEVKQAFPDCEGVSSGAIASTYQKLRVEDVCARLGMTSLAYLWMRDQDELLQEMIDKGMVVILIKVAAAGLVPEKHLGKTITELKPHFEAINKKFGFNVCGEGGEYESLTLDCPIYKKRMEIKESELIMHSHDIYSPVGYLRISDMAVIDK